MSEINFKKKDQKNQDKVTLRKRAEEILQDELDSTSELPKEKMQHLVHELRTHQIELELQNEELRKAQQELLISQKKYTDLYDFAPVGYLTINDKGLILTANLSAADMLGTARIFLINQPLFCYISTDYQDIHYHCRKTLLEKKEPLTCDLRMQKKNGSQFDAQCKYVTNSDVDGETGRFRMGITDISARKTAERRQARLELQLRQAHKMEAIGTMAGGIAHDFNNILAVVLGYADMAIDDVPELSPAKHSLEQIVKVGNRAKDIVRHLLAFSHMPGSEQDYAPVPLSPLVKEVLKFQRSIIPTTIDIRSDVDENCGQIMGDPTQVHQVLMNFCTNATHAMEEKGGTFEVILERTELTENDQKNEPGLHGGTYLRLAVTDTGHGMTPEIIEKIFDPYFTTKEVDKGSGMGLSVVHGIVKNHGGFVKVESEPGKGSTFNVFFPRIKEEIITEDPDKVEDLPTGSEKILFVDDVKMLTDIGKSMLETLGYSVTTKNDSSEALELFQSDPAWFDLVITDEVMPKFTGSELAKHFLKIRPDIPIILCTGYSAFIDEVKAQKIGIKEYIMKPANRHELSKLIRKVLDGDESDS